MTAAKYQKAVLLALKAIVISQPHGITEASTVMTQDALDAIDEALAKGDEK